MGSAAVAACACEGTLTLLAFHDAAIQRSGSTAVVETTEAAFPLTMETLLHAGTRGTRPPGTLAQNSGAWSRSHRVAVVDIVLLRKRNRWEVESGVADCQAIALLVDESVGGDPEDGGRNDGGHRASVRICRWDVYGDGSLSPGDW